MKNSQSNFNNVEVRINYASGTTVNSAYNLVFFAFHDIFIVINHRYHYRGILKKQWKKVKKKIEFFGVEQKKLV